MEVSETIGTPQNKMPELPEVETIKNTLLPLLKNRKILNVEIYREKTVLGDPLTFKNKLTNQTFKTISRKGKYLIFHLTNDLVVLSHLRMEGKYFVFPLDKENTKHAKVVFTLDNDTKLIFDDSRCFGIMKLENETSYLDSKELKILGKEPFDIEDVSYLYEKAKKFSLNVKQFLLDQSVMAGLGNIYVDETLYKAKIHPLTPAQSLSLEECENLIHHAKETLLGAIIDGGSTIKSYHPGHNIDGKFQTKLLCYGKHGEKCPHCGATFRFIKINGRGTTFCPNCQQVRKSKIFVGITGKIASGKSEALSYFKMKGYPCISSDEVVANLYEEKEVIESINKTFSLTFKNKIDRKVLRDKLLEDPKNVNKINKLIHPLVKEEILSFMSKADSPLVFAEVPLLYEAKFESIFDFIIALDVSKDVQIGRLNKRNPTTKEQLEKIYDNKSFDEYKKLADIIIINDIGIHQLYTELETIINKLLSRLS